MSTVSQSVQHSVQQSGWQWGRSKVQQTVQPRARQLAHRWSARQWASPSEGCSARRTVLQSALLLAPQKV
jgi:hypothetical protein